MSEQTQWPHGPWFTRLGLVLSVGGLVWLVQIQKRHMQLVPREDLNAFIRVTLPAIPGWSTYTVLETAKGELAVPSDPGTLYRASIKPDRQKLKAFLQSDVYQQPMWRVLQWPLLAFLVLFVGLVRLGRYLDAAREGGRIIRGPRLISNWAWNLRTLFKERGFYIHTQ